MVHIETEDYIYIEAIGLILYYFDIDTERRPLYTDFYKEAVKIAKSRTRNHVSDPVIKELVAQDAIAFKIGDNDFVQPSGSIGSIFDTLYRYTGDTLVSVYANIDVINVTLFDIELKRLVEIFHR